VTGQPRLAYQNHWFCLEERDCSMFNFDDDVIDDLDFVILAHLQEDGRKSFTQIAKELNIAVGTVRNRVLKLIKDKTLHIVARVDPHRVGFKAPATIMISILPEHLAESSQEIALFPEVSYVSIVTGPYNVMVDVMCRDARHLTDFLVHRLAKVKGVKDYQTLLILHVFQFAQPDLKIAKNIDPSKISEHMMVR
jgi:Lrp/AsnC family transcriptional regulator, regulator for asnA, asnC and gidA